MSTTTIPALPPGYTARTTVDGDHVWTSPTGYYLVQATTPDQHGRHWCTVTDGNIHMPAMVNVSTDELTHLAAMWCSMHAKAAGK